MNNPSKGKGALKDDPRLRPYFKSEGERRALTQTMFNQAAGGYVTYDAESGRYSLDDAQALCLANPDSPVDLAGAYYIVEAAFHALERTTENFRSGQGMEWGEHHACLFHGTERFFRAGYHAHLLAEWLPALDGAVEKLERGASAPGIDLSTLDQLTHQAVARLARRLTAAGHEPG